MLLKLWNLYLTVWEKEEMLLTTIFSFQKIFKNPPSWGFTKVEKLWHSIKDKNQEMFIPSSFDYQIKFIVDIFIKWY